MSEKLFIDFWGSALQDQVVQLCKLLEGDSKEFCYQLLGSRLVDVFPYPFQREKICAYSEPSYRQVCEESAGTK